MKVSPERQAWLKWYARYMVDYMEILRRTEKCVCCGAKPIEFDHIFGWRKLIKRYEWRRYRHPELRMADLKRGNIQFLCRPCNIAKFVYDECPIHNRYLGIWNHLPHLTEMEGLVHA